MASRSIAGKIRQSAKTPKHEQSNGSNAKSKPNNVATPTPAIPEHVISELFSLWSSDSRVPSASSRRKWSALREVDPLRINRWFLNRKAAAKKAGNPISEETYELSLDPPPIPPPVLPSPSVLAASGGINTNESLSSPLPSVPPARPRGRPRKKIKVEEPGSDDAAYGSAATPFSDDTLVSPNSDEDPSISSGHFENSPRRLKRAYSHLSQDAQDDRQARVPLAESDAGVSFPNYDDQRYPSARSPCHSGSSPSLIDSLPVINNTNHDPRPETNGPPFIRDSTPQISAQGTSLNSASNTAIEDDGNSSSDSNCALLVSPCEEIDCSPDTFWSQPSVSSGPSLSTLLSSDILFELLPFSDYRRPFQKSEKPVPMPTSNFSSIAFIYRLPAFPDPQPPSPAQPTENVQEYLEVLESQPPLSDPKCDLSSFDRWNGDPVFELHMSDEMLDEFVGRRTGDGDEEGDETDVDSIELTD